MALSIRLLLLAGAVPAMLGQVKLSSNRNQACLQLQFFYLSFDLVHVMISSWVSNGGLQRKLKRVVLLLRMILKFALPFLLNCTLPKVTCEFP
jgi:hypothetical protein